MTMPDGYFERSDQFDMALDLTAGRRGLAALGDAIARWVRHVLAVEVAVEPLTEVRDAKFTWYVGLDAEGTRIGDALWNGEELDDATRAPHRRALSPDLPRSGRRRRKVGGEPVYLILAMTADKMLRMKPQNLIAGLPVRHLEAVS